MRLVWLAPLLLIACAHANVQPTSEVTIAVQDGRTRTIPVEPDRTREPCFGVVEPPPLVWREPMRLDRGPDGLPYAIDIR